MATKTLEQPSGFQKLVMTKWMWLLFCGFFFAYPIYRAFNRELPPEAPILSTVSSFKFISDQKEITTPESLKGRTYIAHFTCLACEGNEDILKDMQKIQKRVKGLTTSVAIATFSTQPQVDSVEKIFAKGREIHNNPFVWKLLTSKDMDAKGMESFQKDNFPMIAENKADFALVDTVGNVRGYYTNTKNDVNAMMIDLGLIINRSKLNFKKIQR